MLHNQPIALFDSGIGGLSIWRELHELLPHESIIYFADQAYCPYGTKTDDEIRKRVISALRFLQTKDIKLTVIACNTATTVGIDYYRECFPNLPIIGIVPVIKTAAQVTKTKKVLVLATQKTIQSSYLDVLINKFGQGIKFYKIGDWEGQLVKMIEERQLEQKKISEELSIVLSPFVNQNIDVVVLGCTHFPFIKNQIQEVMGTSVQILDSGGAVARQVKRVLESRGPLAQDQKPNYTFYTTGKVKKFISIANQLIGHEIQIRKAISVKGL